MKIYVRLFLFSASILVAVAFAVVLWPNSSIVAPEKTGEIGFMGLVVITKYIHYFFRLIAAIVIPIAFFNAAISAGSRFIQTKLDCDSTEQRD